MTQKQYFQSEKVLVCPVNFMCMFGYQQREKKA